MELSMLEGNKTALYNWNNGAQLNPTAGLMLTYVNVVVD